MGPGRGVFPSLKLTGSWGGVAITLLLGSYGTGRAAEEPAPLSCFELLQQNNQVDENLATQLCSGAHSTAPAQCFLRVQHDSDLSAPQAVQLCQYATPADDPAGCYLQARNKGLLDSWRAVRLCQPEVNVYCPTHPYR